MAVRVTEVYREWQPPISGARTVQRLLREVPDVHLAGLGQVVLTNSGSLARRRRRATAWVRGRKIAVHEARGLYHPKRSGEAPWIELFVDRVLAGVPRWVLCLRPLRDWFFADVLFHEVGHHIHATAHKEYADREAVADRWRRTLLTAYFRRRYWYLRPLALLYTRARRWKR